MKWIGIAALTGALLGAVLFADHALGSRNSSGTMSVPNTFVTGAASSAPDMNTNFSDFATEMTDSLNRSGKGGMLAALRGIDGVVTAPAFSFTSETGTGIYRIGSSDLGVAINQSKKLELTSSLFTVTPNATFSGFITSGTASSTQAKFGATGDTPIGIFTATTTPNVTSNATNDGSTGWKYATSNSSLAESLEMGNAGFLFYTAPAGTAGNAITFTERFRVSTTGITTTGTVTQGSSGQLTSDASGNLNTSGTITTTGIATAAQFTCSSFAASGTRCGNGSLNGSGDATITVVSGLHCVCSTAVVAAPAAFGCNVSGTTLTLKGGANATFTYLCF